MCMSKIEKVYYTTEPITAYKAQGVYAWSGNLHKLLEDGDWQRARMSVIDVGGGPGIMSMRIPPTKTVVEYIRDSITTLVSDVHLSGWSAFLCLEDAKRLVDGEDFSFVPFFYRVHLRGFIQEAANGELTASEMRVIERVY